MSNSPGAIFHGPWRVRPTRATRWRSTRPAGLFRAGLAVAVAILAVLGAAQRARALNGYWQPPGISPLTTPTSVVLAAIDQHRGVVSASYAARLRLVVGSRTFTTDALVRGADVRYTTVLDDARYTSGRVGGTRWRRTPAGLVRILESDVQGDPLDRWPVSPLPFDPADCSLVGEIRGAERLWVLQDAPSRDVMHWFYVDETTGAIVRELTRDGTAEFTTAFDDERTAAGAQRPFHWRISGFGGRADVFVESIEPQTVDPQGLAVPPSEAAPGTVHGSTVTLPAHFDANRIMVNVAVNGHPGKFLLDSGTTQVLVAAGAAKRFGIPTLLDHGIAGALDAGGLHLRNQPVMTVPDIFGIDGILGYDLFATAIVHLDFERKLVELIPRATFTPPQTAVPVPITFTEGIPIATAALGALRGDRFALDTGSGEFIVPRYFWEHHGREPRSLPFTPIAGQAPQTEHYLEGPIVTVLDEVPDLTFGDVGVTNVVARVEKTNSGATLDIPFDGIVGTDILALFEWWFDAAGGKAWTRAR